MSSASPEWKVVLADDHAMFRQGIKYILAEMEGIRIVGEAGDGLALLDLIREVDTDLVILDISMPKLRGIEAASEIKAVRPGTKILILTMHQSAEYFYHAVSAGAEGFLLKSDADTELQHAIRTLQEGKTYVSPQISKVLAEEVFALYRGGSGPDAEPLTVRQREILKLIAEGKSNQEIAALLYISVRTVEHHRANMMKKLNLKNTAELVRYAIRKGYSSLTG